MRRVIVEAPVAELGKLVWDWLAKEVESFETIYLFKKDQIEVAAICKVNFKNPKTGYKDAFKESGITGKLLYRENDGAGIFFIKGRPKIGSQEKAFWAIGGYVSSLGLKEGTLKLNFLGSAKEVKALLRYFSGLKINHKVDLLTDAKFSPDSPLNCLTSKQRQVLLTAFNLGYYDIPRKIRSDELAKRLSIGNPTLVMHRRKAERRLLANILSKSL